MKSRRSFDEFRDIVESDDQGRIGEYLELVFGARGEWSNESDFYGREETVQLLRENPNIPASWWRILPEKNCVEILCNPMVPVWIYDQAMHDVPWRMNKLVVFYHHDPTLTEDQRSRLSSNLEVLLASLWNTDNENVSFRTIFQILLQKNPEDRTHLRAVTMMLLDVTSVLYSYDKPTLEILDLWRHDVASESVGLRNFSVINLPSSDALQEIRNMYEFGSLLQWESLGYISGFVSVVIRKRHKMPEILSTFFRHFPSPPDTLGPFGIFKKVKPPGTDDDFDEESEHDLEREEDDS